MNKLTIIGNLTKDPELRITATGLSVCTFTVAVNKRKAQQGEQETDFFRVTAWRERGETCAKYLRKGRKVCVVGAVGVNTFTANDGATRANLEVTADEVEFLPPRDLPPEVPETQTDAQTGFQQVKTDDLPF